MITIYGKSNCTYCDQAKALLDSKGIPYNYLMLGADYVVEQVKSIAPTARTFPVIVVDGQYIGGFAELRTRIGLLEQSNGMNGPSFLSEEKANG